MNGVTWSNWPLFAFFGQVYSARHVFDGDPVAWSLCTEMSFYLLLPLYAFVADRWLRRTRTELLTLSALGVAGIAVGQAVLTSGHAYLTYSALGTFDWFAIGMLLAVLTVDPAWSTRLGRLSRHSGLIWLAALAVLVAANVVTGGTQLNLAFAVVATLAFLPAIARSESSVPARVLGTPAVAWLGLVSYGLYLWHLPLAQELETRLHDGAPVSRAAMLLVPALVVAVAAGALSYYVVELPFLRKKDRAVRTPAPAET